MDPADVGPVYEEEDPNTFMQHLENLIALGGGDEPEMCFSAILVKEKKIMLYMVWCVHVFACVAMCCREVKNNR